LTEDSRTFCSNIPHKYRLTVTKMSYIVGIRVYSYFKTFKILYILLGIIKALHNYSLRLEPCPYWSIGRVSLTNYVIV